MSNLSTELEKIPPKQFFNRTLFPVAECAVQSRHGPFLENLAGQRPLTVFAPFLAERKRNGEG